MKTEVIMQRQTLGEIISQKSKSGFFNLTELILAGNKYRAMNGMPLTKIDSYFKNSANIEFMKELENKYGKIKTDGRGRNVQIWAHPLLFLDVALWIDPRMKVEVYEWLMDNLIQFRNDSGDSYKKMCGSLFLYAKDKTHFNKNIQKVARLIKLECGAKDWETATEQQLKLRDKMHEYISLACDIVKNSNHAIEIGIMKAKESLK